MLALALAVYLLASPQPVIIPASTPEMVNPSDPVSNRKARRRAAKLAKS